MGAWSKEDLRKIAEAADLHIAPFRADGVTYGTPTWICSVAVDMTLSTFARTTDRAPVGISLLLRQKAGRITGAGLTKQVAFESVMGPSERPHR